MLIGEAPGEQETLQGRPLWGESGGKTWKAFCRLFIASGGNYISNVVKVRPVKVSARGSVSNRRQTGRRFFFLLPGCTGNSSGAATHAGHPGQVALKALGGPSGCYRGIPWGKRRFARYGRKGRRRLSRCFHFIIRHPSFITEPHGGISAGSGMPGAGHARAGRNNLKHGETACRAASFLFVNSNAEMYNSVAWAGRKLSFMLY